MHLPFGAPYEIKGVGVLEMVVVDWAKHPGTVGVNNWAPLPDRRVC